MDVEDFSMAGLAMRKHFVHELTHVWQHQRGVDLVWEKLLMWFRYGAFGGYEYEAGEDFFSYNIEQQACVVADWYEVEMKNPTTAREQEPGSCEGLVWRTQYPEGKRSSATT